jgi:hypothetical protein
MGKCMMKMRYSPREKIAASLALYAVALALGIASVVLSILSVASYYTIGALLGIGVFCLGVAGLRTIQWRAQ